jgi:hypothetical protein
MIVREKLVDDGKKQKRLKSFRDLLDAIEAIEANHGYQVNAIMHEPKRSHKHIYK